MRLIGYLVVALASFPVVAGSYDDFFRALIRNDGPAAIKLIDRGFDANARYTDGQPGLIVALRAQSDEAALVLARDPRVDPNVRNQAGETPVLWAALRNQLPTLQALAARGGALQPEGWTPLHYAASGDAPDVARWLLSQGVTVDARSPNGRTPLMQAARFASEEVIDMLLAAGADPKLEDLGGSTTAQAARGVGRDRLADRLESLTQKR
jgi:ankyrin repeat protein